MLSNIVVGFEAEVSLNCVCVSVSALRVFSVTNHNGQVFLIQLCQYNQPFLNKIGGRRALSFGALLYAGRGVWRGIDYCIAHKATQRFFGEVYPTTRMNN